MNENLCRPQFNKLKMAEKLALMQALADRYHMNFKELYAFSRWGQSCTTGGLGDGSIVFFDLVSGKVRGYNCDYADLEEIAENFPSLILSLVEQALELEAQCRES